MPPQATPAGAARFPSGTVTFLFTDVVRSTSLLTALGRERYAELLDRHHQVVETAVADSHGTIVDRAGDGLLAAFDAAPDGIAAAVAAQRRLAAERLDSAPAVSVRMGLDTGDVLLRGQTYVGAPLHRGARICAAAGGSQVLLSAATQTLVDAQLPEGVSLRDVGGVALDGFSGPVVLFQAILDDIPESATTPRVRSGRSAALLDREDDLAALEEHVAQIERGAGSVVAIEGPAGMGKTSLVEAARIRALERGVLVLSGRATHLETEYPFGIVRQLFELAVAQAVDADALFAGAAAPARPIVDQRASSAPVGDGFAILHGLYWLAVNSAQEQPLLIAVDDLQWCDPPSLRYLSYLARRIADLPIGLVVAARTGEPPSDEQAYEGILHDPATRRIAPAALTEAAVAELLRRALAAEPDPRFTSACREAAGANPLLVHELAGALTAAGVKPVASSVDAIPRLGPRAVSDFVLRRLARLPDAARELARAVAVLGDGAELTPAADLAGLDRATAADASARLARADLLGRGSTLGFVHPLVRDAVYDAMTTSEREQAHARASEILAWSGAGPVRVALHLLQAPTGGGLETVTALRQAARRSLADGVPASAATFLERGLSEELPDEERATLLVELGSAELRFAADRAAVHLREAMQFVDVPERRAEVALLVGRALYNAGQYEESVAVLDRGLEELDDRDTDLGYRLESELVGPLSENIQPERVRQLLRDAHSRNLKPGPGRRMLQGQLAASLSLGMTRDETIAISLEAVGDDVLLEDETSDLFMWATSGLVNTEQYPQALDALNRAVEHARRRGSIQMLVAALHFRGRVYYYLGQLAEAEIDARSGLEALELHVLPLNQPWLVSVLADVLLESESPEHAAAALALATPLPRSLRPSSLLQSHAKVALALHRPLDVLVETDELAPRYTKEYSSPQTWRVLAALALAELGRSDEAVRLAAEELESARDWGGARTLGRALRVAGLIDPGPDRLTLMHEAVAVLETSPAQLELAHALGSLGAALRRAGKRVDARDAMRHAIDRAHSCGARALEQRLRDELVAAGGRPRRVMVSGVDSLTSSELRVARLAAAGKSNREIAQELFVTLKTVEMHLANAFRKLEISSRTQLAGLLEPAETAG